MHSVPLDRPFNLLRETLLEHVLLLRITSGGTLQVKDFSRGQDRPDCVQNGFSQYQPSIQSDLTGLMLGMSLEEAFPAWRGSDLWPALDLVCDGADSHRALFSWQSDETPQRDFIGSAQKLGDEVIICFLDVTEKSGLQQSLIERSEELLLTKGKLDETRQALNQTKTRLQILSQSDVLTGLANRRYFLDRARAELRKARRYGADLGLIVLDIDDLGRINSQFGADGGDQVIVAIAEVLRNSCRIDVDLPARLGGEDFAVLLPFTGLHAAATLARRFQRRIAGLNIPVGPALFPDDPDRHSLSTTACFGVASARMTDQILSTSVPRSARPGRPFVRNRKQASHTIGSERHLISHSFDEVLQKALMALRQAKDTGKNQVVW